jgi:hypothetical protein
LVDFQGCLPNIAEGPPRDNFVLHHILLLEKKVILLALVIVLETSITAFFVGFHKSATPITILFIHGMTCEVGWKVHCFLLLVSKLIFDSVTDDAIGIALTTCFSLVLHKRDNTLMQLFAVACILVDCVPVHIGARIEPRLVDCLDSLIAQIQNIHKRTPADIKGKAIRLALSHP